MKAVNPGDQAIIDGTGKKRRNKFGATKVTVDGESFDSKREHARHLELLALQRGGVIRDLKRQPKYDLVVNDQHICRYVGDWFYFEGDQRVCEDSKSGFQTPEFKIKWKLANALFPVIEWRLTGTSKNPAHTAQKSQSMRGPLPSERTAPISVQTNINGRKDRDRKK